LWISPADPSFDPLSFDWDSDVSKLTPESPLVTYSTSLNIDKFKSNHGKIIWYHGLSDPGPSVSFTIEYYEALAKKYGGFCRLSNFSRLYFIPTKGARGGGASYTPVRFRYPLVEWVEYGIPPDEVIASGTSFTSEPTTRSRPLCPYPEEVRHMGPAGGDLSDPSNYKCVKP